MVNIFGLSAVGAIALVILWLALRESENDRNYP